MYSPRTDFEVDCEICHKTISCRSELKIHKFKEHSY